MNLSTALTTARRMVEVIFDDNEFKSAEKMINERYRYQLSIHPDTTTETLTIFDRMISNELQVRRVELLINPKFNLTKN